MKSFSNDAGNNEFSGDLNENLRMENELLHLKIKAELNVETQGIRHPDPEVENKFLKQILEFERKATGIQKQKVYNLLNKPAVKKLEEMDDEAVATALKQLILLLFENNIEVFWGDERDPRVKYRFITEEIFAHEMYDPSKDDFTARFDYERFHPNHEKKLQKIAKTFLTGWLQQDLSKSDHILSSRFMLPNRSTPGKNEVLARIKLVFDSYSVFAKGDYTITNTTLEMEKDKTGDTGFAHVDGHIKYTGILENGQTVLFDDKFTIFMAYKAEQWRIFFFKIPGFSL